VLVCLGVRLVVCRRVDMEMRRVKRLWHESEHRLLLLQSELRTAQVTQKAVVADLGHMETANAAQAQRIDELVRGAALDHQAQRERVDALETAREAARMAKAEAAELSLQMVAGTAAIAALREEARAAIASRVLVSSHLISSQPVAWSRDAAVAW
jgi:hypothetical protein